MPEQPLPTGCAWLALERADDFLVDPPSIQAARLSFRAYATHAAGELRGLDVTPDRVERGVQILVAPADDDAGSLTDKLGHETEKRSEGAGLLAPAVGLCLALEYGEAKRTTVRAAAGFQGQYAGLRSRPSTPLVRGLRPTTPHLTSTKGLLALEKA